MNIIQVNINNSKKFINIEVENTDTIDSIKNKIINQVNFKNIRLYPIKNNKILTGFSYEGLIGSELFTNYIDLYDSYIILPFL